MKRRTLLRGASTGLVAGLAGCLGSTGTGDPDDDPSDTPTDTPSPPTSPSPTPGSNDVDASFRLTGAGSGVQNDDAEVSFGDPLTVTGTVWGANGCYTADMAAATLTDGRLTVVVRAFKPETDTPRACTDAIVQLDYEVTAEAVDPETVVVVHERDGERTEVARAER